jgi:hypothetical protein
MPPLDELAPAPPTPAAPSDDLPRRPPGPSVRLALIVLGICAVLFLGGTLALALSPSSAPAPTTPTVRTAPGAPVPAMAATGALGKIQLNGDPPGDVASAVVLPQGATIVPGSIVNRTVGQYDESIDVTVPDSQATTLAFYAAELPAEGWQHISHAAAANDPQAVQYLAQRAASDGNYWELGVAVQPTSFGPGAPPTGSTRITVRLYIVADDE